MATPPRLIKLLCPMCRGRHWVVDFDNRETYLLHRDPAKVTLRKSLVKVLSDLCATISGNDPPYMIREYACPKCNHRGRGYLVLQKSPIGFLLQPHPLFPMTQRDFNHWYKILRENFPDYRLKDESWHPAPRSLPFVRKLRTILGRARRLIMRRQG